MSGIPLYGYRSNPIGFLRALLAIATIAWTPMFTGACSPQPRTARNAILISIDTLRADRMGCYGYARPTTPSLDRFAASGAVFENAIAQSPWTLPSHAAMLTGKFPHRNGMVDESRILPEEEPTLAMILKDHAYSTAGFINSRWLSWRQGFDKGFMTYQRFHDIPGHLSEEITDSAIAWLDENHENRFFLFVHYYDVHSPYDPKTVYREKLVKPYEGSRRGETEELKAVRDGSSELAPEDVIHISDLYDGEIRQLDSQLGRLFDHIHELDLDADTLVVFTSDHGEEFMEHGSVLHGRTMFREVLHVPLIMRGPGVEAGLRIEEICMLTDVVPTILGRLGVPVDLPFDGVDLIQAIDDLPSSLANRLAFAEADHHNEKPDILRMVQNERFKFCYNRLTGERELYDLLHDPSEQTNIAEENEILAEGFMKRIEQFMTGKREAGVIAPRTREEIEELKKLGY